MTCPEALNFIDQQADLNGIAVPLVAVHDPFDGIAPVTAILIQIDPKELAHFLIAWCGEHLVKLEDRKCCEDVVGHAFVRLQFQDDAHLGERR